MRNIKLTIEYDGSNYSGWQMQNNVITVQEVVIKTLEDLLKEKVDVIGCSRTDTCVHAKGYVLNFHSNTSIPGNKIKYALNNKLPSDIVILESEDIDNEFHARYSCKGKTYVYTILNREMPSSIERNYVYHYKNILDIDNMKKAAKYFLGTHDFLAFKNQGSSVKTSVRTITDLKIIKNEDKINIYISADGFLYNMVRIIVGTLISVGEKRIKPEDIISIINSKDRRKAGITVPAQGLCLLKVYY